MSRKRQAKPRVGVIGVGFGARLLVPALRTAGYEVVALAARSTTNARRAAETLSIADFSSDAEGLTTRPDIDLVCVASPPSEHHGHVMAALRSGKAVLCEKPLAVTAEDAKEMWDAARVAGVPNCVDHEFRFLRTRTLVRELIDGGELGAISVVEVAEHAARLRDPSEPAASWWLSRNHGGGQLAALGSHWIDSLQWWVGPVARTYAELRTVVARRPTARGGEPVNVTADDTASLLMAFVSGAIATLNVSAVSAVPSRRAVLHAANAVLRMEDNSVLGIDWYDGRRELHRFCEPDIPGEGQPSQFRALVSMLQCLRQHMGGAAPGHLATFRDGWQVQSVLDAAYQSANAGKASNSGH